ncbi:MAG: non-canonical purine NTP pyrophosphatase [Candidatus Saccharimonadales bacterium]
MQILIATHNQAKLVRYQKILAGVEGIELISLGDLNISDKVEEDCKTNIENAVKKAVFYGDLSGLITVGVDEALMTNFLPDGQQPGVYARRFSASRRELTDPEVIEVWKKIFELYPQDDKQFIWDFAVAYYNPVTKQQGTASVQQISYATKHFSDVLNPGYPMSSFMSPDQDGKPYSELTEADYYRADNKNFASFVKVFDKWICDQSSIK